MEYTLFFSYQSDTKLEFNFIKDALSEVKSNLSLKEVDLRVDYGMRDVAGNPNLLKEMLKKGEECDIFLADLTYVTDFTNAQGNQKHVPNPNVMLELGHAWNFHGNSHTIFIQNTIKGQSEDLPVDLKGFRFPVSYKLDEETPKEDRIKKRRILSEDLTKAIEAVIKSIEDCNKTKYLPFEKFALCQLHNNNEKFVVTKYFSQLSKKITDKLVFNQFVTIAGKSESGKSIMIKEFISREYCQSKQNNTLYCKYTQTDSTELYKTLKELLSKKLRRDTLLILDNCNEIIAKEVQHILCNSPHKCIFIMESAGSSDSTQIKIDPMEYTIEIIANIAPGRESELVNKCGYNPEYIIRTVNNISYTPHIYNVDSDSTALLGYISLFSKVGFYKNKENEFNHICQLFKFSVEKGCSIVKQLIDKGYIISQGKFIFIDSDNVANEYAKNMWQQNLASELSFNELIKEDNLAEWFINRQIQIASQSKECVSFLKNIIKCNFRDISFIDSKLGKYIVPKLAEVYPKEVLTSLELLCNKNKKYDFQEIYGILWALHIIIRKKGLFNRVITLLLNLKDGSSYNKVDMNEIVSDYFKRINYDYNPNVSTESFNDLYSNGYIDIVKNVYSSIFNVGYKDLIAEQSQYLQKMFSFLISIRVENKDWANSIIVSNVLQARLLGISRQVFTEIRAIAEENETGLNVAEVLSNKIRWASNEDKKAIKSLLKSISDKSLRSMLYCKVVLFKSDTLLDRESFESSLSDIATEILQNKGWEDNIDILLRGGRKYDANCMWFGCAISQQYKNCDKLITKCLDLYRKIPVEDQSYGLIIGLFHKYVLEDNMLIYKQKRNELLEYPEFINIAISLSIFCENSIDDLMNLKRVLVTNELPLSKLNDYCISLSEVEYCSFAEELIKLNKEGADAGIILLDRAKNNYEKINISNCVKEIVIRYNYWEATDYSHDSTYSKLIDLLVYSLNTYPNDSLAESIIISMLNGANSQYFNNNCSLVDLFKALIEKYQELFLEHVLPIITNDSFEIYRKRHNLEGLFLFQHTSDNDLYLKWCEKNGNLAAEFVARFIPLLKEENGGNIIWTDEAKILMNRYSNDSYVLSCISTRLFNGEVSIAKYSRLKRVYDLLNEEDNTFIRLWAIEQSENMDTYIQREKDRIEDERIWYK